MEQHLKHIKYLESLLSKESPQSNEWWNIKNKLDQVRISWAQAWNLAVSMMNVYSNEDKMKINVLEQTEKLQSYFYDRLTAPLTEGLKESYEAGKKKKEMTEKEKLLNQEI